jgi:AcrR family transcriptional regulator
VTECQDRRQLILDRAGELFAQKGVSGTTVREIGDAVGILSGSLYHYFSSKDEIVLEILARYVDDLLGRSLEIQASFPDDPEKCLIGLIQSSFVVVDAHRNASAIFQKDFVYLRSLPRYAEPVAKIRELTKVWMDVLRDGQARGVFRSDVDPRLLHAFARDCIANAVHWLPESRHFTMADAADACVAVFLTGFLQTRS